MTKKKRQWKQREAQARTGPPVAPPSEQGVFRSALAETEKVGVRLDAAFAAKPHVDMLFDLLGGMVFNAAEKLVDRVRQGEPRRPLDEAMIRTCSRISTESVAGYLLVRRGLILPASEVLRGALEAAMQAMMFLEHPERAERWFKGAQYKPSVARDDSAAAGALYQTLYDRLSEAAHPRLAALILHTVDLADIEPEGIALTYGGWFAPRLAGSTACEFLRVQLAFLRAFYRHYESELETLGLRFRPGTLAFMQASDWQGEIPADTFDKLLDVYQAILEEAERHFAALPPDEEEVAAWLAQRAATNTVGGGTG